MTYPKIILKGGKEAATKRFHHWVFSGAIKNMIGSPQDGDVVKLFSSRDEFLGIGHYQHTGSISVRIISFKDVEINQLFWNHAIENATSLRKTLGFPSESTNCFRLIHGEGDGLPGLILDYYNGVVVMLCYTAGMYNARPFIVEALKNLFKDDLVAVYDKSGELLPDKPLKEYLYGPAISETEALEYGNKFLINWEEGQKSGFFLDQRENRQLLQGLVKDKKVLNTFCYSGGFSIYALMAQAQHVTSVDISDKAMAMTHKNVRLNGFDDKKHSSVTQDVMKYIKETEDQFDVIILDPPAFAKHLSARHNAVQAYKRLNAEALRKINNGGFLLTFSCSQVVDKIMFTKTIKSAAIEVGRSVKVLNYLGQPADHPVNIFHPETEYLKGLLLYVEQ